jgi:hypothetical protein
MKSRPRQLDERRACRRFVPGAGHYSASKELSTEQPGLPEAEPGAGLPSPLGTRSQNGVRQPNRRSHNSARQGSLKTNAQRQSQSRIPVAAVLSSH